MADFCSVKRITMIKNGLGFSKNCMAVLLLLTSCSFSIAGGLENIIVEKYYISGAKDTAGSAVGGKLALGSVTYRIYVDMAPGYKFQAAYGSPTHPLRMTTSTLFFNNSYRGTTVANAIPASSLNQNTVRLDSWLSAGAASEGNMAVLLTENNQGLLPGTPAKVTGFNIDSAISVLNNSTSGSLFTTSNGSWACLEGASGPTEANRVLIAQMTTDGDFSFELNIQIGIPGGAVEKYVAKNPEGNEIEFATLTYRSATITKSNNKKSKYPEINK